MKLTQHQIRNLIALGVLLVLACVVGWWVGIFDAKGSDEDQIRRLTENARTEFNDHDWEDALQYCWVEPNTRERRQQWIKSIPNQANAINLDSILPTVPLSVPVGANEYVIEVSIIAHGQVAFFSGGRINVPKGTIFYVRKNGLWLIDLERSAPTFGVPVPRP